LKKGERGKEKKTALIRYVFSRTTIGGERLQSVMTKGDGRERGEERLTGYNQGERRKHVPMM